MSREPLSVTIVQSELHWESPEENRNRFSRLIRSSNEIGDIVVLPEMFTTGFSMNTGIAEADSKTIGWMQQLAADTSAAIVGSVMVQSEGRNFNRLYFVLPGGRVHTYDKRHLFSFADEHNHFDAGSERLIVEFRDWRICPMICYDLRFPVWSRNADLNGGNSDHVFDMLIYVANWPEARQRPWVSLLEARAHENQCFVVGVNRIGSDGNGISYAGDSAVFSPKGERLSETKPMTESLETITVSMDELDEFRRKFTPWRDKDQFSLTN